jgi:hypothetical protein
MVIEKTYSEKNVPQCHIVRHKSRVELPEIEPKPPRYEAGDYSPLR